MSTDDEFHSISKTPITDSNSTIVNNGIFFSDKLNPELSNIDKRVPQGCSLSPSIFLVYIEFVP